MSEWTETFEPTGLVYTYQHESEWRKTNQADTSETHSQASRTENLYCFGMVITTHSVFFHVHGRTEY